MQEGYSRLKGARWHGAGYKGDWSTADTWDPPGMSNSEMKARILHYSDLSADLQDIKMGILANMLNLRDIKPKRDSFCPLYVH
jgi:hypothetical protein